MTEEPDSGCWRRIGIWGDGSCGELKQVEHCHDCGKFTAAALTVLERPDAPLDANALARELAFSREGVCAGLGVVVFRVGARWLALAAKAIIEVGVSQAPCRLPHQRPGVLRGLVAMRGEIMPCCDLTPLLDLLGPAPVEGVEGKIGRTPTLAPAVRQGPPRLLVLGDAHAPFAVPADEVLGLRQLPAGQLAPASVSFDAADSGSVVFAQLLDADLLLAALQRSLR